MKYWNKDKKTRLESWYKVDCKRHPMRVLPRGFERPHLVQSYASSMKVWCQQHPSTGRFYNYYASDLWWFEREEDALLFTLTWCS